MVNKKSIFNRKNILAIIEIIIGCLLCSIAVNWVAEPNGLVVTGTTGLSQALGVIFSLDFRLIYYMLTCIVVILTLITMGKLEVMKIILVSIIYPNVLYLLGFIDVKILCEDKLIAIIIFGFLFGLGTGLVYRVGSSFGGTDTLGKICKNSFLKRIQLKKIFLMLDVTILIFMSTVFDLELLVYALIGQIIYVNVLNKVNFFDRKDFYDVEIICEINSFELMSLEKFMVDDLNRKYNKTFEDRNKDINKADTQKLKLNVVLTMSECLKMQDYMRVVEYKVVMKYIPVKAMFGMGRDYLSINDDFDV